MRSVVADVPPAQLTQLPPLIPASASAPAAAPVKPARLTSLDAYRGFIMLAMASAGLAFAKVADNHPDSAFWKFLGNQADHEPWVGCAFWDLIQPAFMFMAGAAVPFAYASRKAKGESDGKILWHVAVRSFALVLLGIFLSSSADRVSGHLLVNVLTQIGLGYFFVYLLRGFGWRVQLAALAVVLVGYWLAFALYPLPADLGADSSAGPAPPYLLPGFFAHWDKHANLAADFDVWLLNLLPAYARQPFQFNPGGYATLNFIPSMGTMILGLMAGELLRGPRNGLTKFGLLVAAGGICLVLGQLAGWTVCPIVKRIWTPSWTLYSAGWVLWMLAAFYAVCDLKGWKRWAFPLTVVGMNSIAIYCMSQLIRGPLFGTFLNLVARGWWDPKEWSDGDYGPVVKCAVLLAVLWLACWGMYRRKLFLKI
jgi:heparan-alpha-glucosaminide N-acetyltransferase